MHYQGQSKVLYFSFTLSLTLYILTIVYNNKHSVVETYKKNYAYLIHKKNMINKSFVLGDRATGADTACPR